MIQIIVVWSVILLAAVVMVIKWPPASVGYIYGIVVGILLAFKYLYPVAVETGEVAHCLALGGGIGSVVGLLSAIAIHNNKGSKIGIIIGSLLLVPILEFIIGFVVIVVLGLALMIQKGQGGTIISSGLITFMLIAGIIGGGGSILVIIIDN